MPYYPPQTSVTAGTLYAIPPKLVEKYRIKILDKRIEIS
jgi:hypothetical protein